MVDEVLISNYNQAINKKYHAVCFDIDKVLYKDNAEEIDDRCFDMLENVLKKKVPVVFITARGDKDLADFINKLTSRIKDIYLLRYIYCLDNDGSRLFFTSIDDKGVFESCAYLSNDVALNELKSFIKEIYVNSNIDKIKSLCNIDFSKDKDKNKLLAMRFNFDCSDEDNSINIEDFDFLLKEVYNIINNNKLYSLNISHYFNNDELVMQITPIVSEFALKKLEMFLGIPNDSMLKIGFSGDKSGKDYKMLNCNSGFSIDEVSGENDRCFPIIANNNKVVKGVNATLFLMKKVKLLPMINLENISKNQFLFYYSKIEKKLNDSGSNSKKVFNNALESNFGVVNGANDLFDDMSGSITISMADWYSIEDSNLLKKLWDSKDSRGNYCYVMRDDNNYLLRGYKNYYNFLSNNLDYKKRIISYDEVVEWYGNVIDFYKKALDTIKILKDDNNFRIEDFNNQKMLLGLLDNVRNTYLIYINRFLESNFSNDNIFINTDRNSDINFHALCKELVFNDYNMYNVSVIEDNKLDLTTIEQILSFLVSRLEMNYIPFKYGKRLDDYSKIFREYREIDNFYENLTSLYLVNQQMKNHDNMGICGITYGGLELPFIYSFIDYYKNINNNICLLKFSDNFYGYESRHGIYFNNFNINDYGGLKILGKITKNNFLVLDDNLLTGKTMQLAQNALFDNNINVSGIGVVRYPSVNRVDQMCLRGHGAVNYNLFFDYINGMVYRSPYSWKDDNSIDKYKDSRGIFDINQNKVLECLKKNCR